jgi:hypothetical protein
MSTDGRCRVGRVVKSKIFNRSLINMLDSNNILLLKNQYSKKIAQEESSG